MTTYTLEFHIDPGHGWLRVPISLARELGVLDKISRYSYTDGTDIYAEEDCDTNVVLRALEARGDSFDLTEHYHRHDAPCRNMRRLPDYLASRRTEVALSRRERDQVHRDLGLTKVRGNLGGTYWE